MTRIEAFVWGMVAGAALILLVMLTAQHYSKDPEKAEVRYVAESSNMIIQIPCRERATSADGVTSLPVA